MSGLEDRIIGARIVGIDTSDGAKVVLYFEQTDDDSGFVVVPLTAIYFDDGGFDTRSAGSAA